MSCSITSIAKNLFAKRSVALFCHMRPDGDCLGSAIAFALALKNEGVFADVYCSDSVPEKYSYLKGASEVKTELKAGKVYDAYVAIDCADVSRIGRFGDLFLCGNSTYNIDHHVSNAYYAKKNYVKDRAANAENVYEILVAAGAEITQDIANALATGIVTDTGNFRHKNVTPETLSIAAALVEKGADLNGIYFNCFAAQSKARAKLYGLVMSKIRYFYDDRIAVISVRDEDLTACGAKSEETEGFIDFIMGICGVEIGIAVMQAEKDAYKISLRSTGADVNAVASTFGGGGHVLASGCRINGEYEEVVDKITFAASRYLVD